MIDHLSTITSEILLNVLFILVARHIFFLPVPKNKKAHRTFLLIWLMILLITEFAIPGGLLSDNVILLNFAILGIYYAYCNTGHPIRGFFLLIPVTGLTFGFFTIILGISYFIPENDVISADDVNALTSGLLFISIILFAVLGKKWRQNYKNEMKYRTLTGRERFTLNSISLLLFVSSMFVSTYIDKSWILEDDVYIFIIMIYTLLLPLLVISMTLQGNKRAYYNSIAELNERYLNAEVAHFNAYQKSQTETRRIRHDMKNHILSLEHLLDVGDIEAAKEYISSIGDSVENLDTDLHTGNSLADAICNEKNRFALQSGIKLSVEGNFPKSFHIANVDLCTILANALDNAIEATSNIDDKNKWIKFHIKVQGNMLFLSFTNPTESNSGIKIGKTSKSDFINHGFGLQNIKYAVQKYNGEMNIELQRTDETDLFVLDIMLLNNN